MPRIILASASPQRHQLLEHLFNDFEILPSSVDELLCPEQDPAKRSIELAVLKARDVSEKFPEAVVIGCDTLVVDTNGATLEKPKDADEARGMLRSHSGSTSIVHSGLCVIGNGKEVSNISSSDVYFNELSDEDIEWWISTNLWKDRSGGFQIDGPGHLMIREIKGDFPGIVGLPIFLLGQMLKEVGVNVMEK